MPKKLKKTTVYGAPAGADIHRGDKILLIAGCAYKPFMRKHMPMFVALTDAKHGRQVLFVRIGEA